MTMILSGSRRVGKSPWSVATAKKYQEMVRERLQLKEAALFSA